MNTPNPIETFQLEAEDLLDQIEEIALEAGQQSPDAEAINRLFRAFHTIKGSGAMFGFDAVAGFTHHVETVLDKVRAGAVPVTPLLIELILAARDQIKVLLENPNGDGASTDDESSRIITSLNQLAGDVALEETPLLSPAVSAEAGAASSWQIMFRPPVQVALSGLDPVSLLEELRGLGACVVTACFDHVPAIETLNAEDCHVAWKIVLTTVRGLNAIKDVFIFVEDVSKITIESLPAEPTEVRAHPATASVSTAVLQNVAPVVSAAKARAKVPAHKQVTKESSVRVPSGRLDRLVNLVGELVMNQSRLTQVAARIDDSQLTSPVEDLERLIAEVRDTVLGIRMMPIGTTFTRFKRLVHDLSGELGKEIDLATAGAETELDKTVIDQLGDPLVHLIRNSIDHGVETPEERVQAGKPRRGTVRLTAAHAGSNVMITVQDDGRGIDAEAVRMKAIERNLITADANLTQGELFNLILLPGFSTAKQVTSVSGRGVGMDVVKREIDALGGSLQISSALGRGTTITATLPLTLAIIDGLLVEVAGDQFIMPMGAVQENVELPFAERSGNNGRNITAVRGELISYINLRESFDIPGAAPQTQKIVIVRHGNDRVGLVVDRVLGSHQTVIQPLGRFYRGIEVLAGATIMGDGRVALILDVAGLVQRANSMPLTTNTN